MSDANIITQMNSFVSFGLNIPNIYLIDYDNLGITIISKAWLDSYYSAFTSSSILLEAFNDYNGLTFIQDDLDDWTTIYDDLVLDGWRDGLTNLLFYSMEATYDREEVLEDNRSLPKKLNDFLDSVGLNSTLRFLVGLVVMAGIGALMGFLHAPSVIILVIELLFFTLFTLLGWFYLWIVFVVTILLALAIILKIKGGSQ
jgi:hypothetical protein